MATIIWNEFAGIHNRSHSRSKWAICGLYNVHFQSFIYGYLTISKNGILIKHTGFINVEHFSIWNGFLFTYLFTRRLFLEQIVEF